MINSDQPGDSNAVFNFGLSNNAMSSESQVQTFTVCEPMAVSTSDNYSINNATVTTADMLTYQTKTEAITASGYTQMPVSAEMIVNTADAGRTMVIDSMDTTASVDVQTVESIVAYDLQQ